VCTTCNQDQAYKVYGLYTKKFDAIDDQQKRFDRLPAEDVIEQVFDLAKTPIVQKAQENKQELNLHGWGYGVGAGIVKRLKIGLSANKQLDEVYQLNF
jgi:carbonic anhydrase